MYLRALKRKNIIKSQGDIHKTFVDPIEAARRRREIKKEKRMAKRMERKEEKANTMKVDDN